MTSTNTPCVIIAGRYADQCGVVLSRTARTVDVLIGSPEYHGEVVTVRRSSVEFYS